MLDDARMTRKHKASIFDVELRENYYQVKKRKKIAETP